MSPKAGFNSSFNYSVLKAVITFSLQLIVVIYKKVWKTQQWKEATMDFKKKFPSYRMILQKKEKLKSIAEQQKKGHRQLKDASV